jgi:hypothetical protein
MGPDVHSSGLVDSRCTGKSIASSARTYHPCRHRCQQSSTNAATLTRGGRGSSVNTARQASQRRLYSDGGWFGAFLAAGVCSSFADGLVGAALASAVFCDSFAEWVVGAALASVVFCSSFAE